MTFTLTALRDDVEADLRDDTNLTWTTAQVDRAIALALELYTRALPQEKTATLTVTGRSADLSAAAPTGLGTEWPALVRLIGAEYPIDLYPAALIRTSLHGSTLTFHTDSTLTAAPVRVYYTRLHQLDGAGGTVPDRDRALLALGAGGYALAQRAVPLGADALATSGERSVERLRAMAQERIDAFGAQLSRLRGIRTSLAYRPGEQLANADIVSWPE